MRRTLIQTASAMFATFLIVVIPALMVLTGCERPNPGARQLAIELSDKIKKQVCLKTFRPGDPCGDRNVQGQADTGTDVHIYIYGVSDKNEIRSLIALVATLRDDSDKRIPADLRFYSDIDGSDVIQSVKLKGK